MAIIPVGSYQPLTIHVGRPTAGASLDITSKVDRDSIRIEETGNHEAAHADFRIIDLTLAHAAMRGRWNVHIAYDGATLFRGIIGSVRPEIAAIYGDINVSAKDIGSLLDDQIIKVYGANGGILGRPAGESDKARISWLFQVAGPRPPYSIDVTAKVQTLNPDMPKQNFPPNLTLRQALERILGGASDSSNYYVSQGGPRLHTFDDDNIETGTDAPYDIVVDRTLSASEIGPIDLEVEWDMSNYFNGYFVRAKTRPYSKFYTDEYPFTDPSGDPTPMNPPYATGLYGDRYTYLDAPDADTRIKVERVVRAALRDTRNPTVRGSFSVEGPRCWNGADRFTSGQYLYVESAVHGLAGRGADAGPWAGPDARPLQPFRIVRNTITVMDGGANLRMEIEFGGRRPHLWQGGA